ncbi:MAG: hypothetical protein ABJH98_12130 [Reichenbachiella sp.]|uniref:hypothetical protein n=1 Tax=Reichenbachiella sp. TaxID=2184521 RepID=UPI0032993283
MCPQLAECTNVAEVHQKHNGLEVALRSTSLNPEARTFPKSYEVSEGAHLRTSPDEAGKEAVWHITDSVC